MPQTKIATCCYCGTRAALVLAGQGSHHLACASCGAPLSVMKSLHPAPAPLAAALPARRQRDGSGLGPVQPATPRRPRKVKRRKGLAQRFFDEAFDAIEDIFD